MSKRGNPTMPKQDKHEKMLSEMHSALYSLGNKIRKPYESDGDKLLPSDLRVGESPEAKAARAHIQTLHKSMKGCKEE